VDPAKHHGVFHIDRLTHTVQSACVQTKRSLLTCARYNVHRQHIHRRTMGA
jgi:hypothetical protein